MRVDHDYRPKAPADGEPTREDVLSATEIVNALIKTAKGLRMYLPNSPLLKKFIQELLMKMQRHHLHYGDFKLDTEQFSFRYKGKTVYEFVNGYDSLAFRMYADGIRSVLFADGVEEQELCSFLNTITLASPVDMHDDIVTRLWQLTLPHLSLILVDDFVEVERHEEEEYIFGSQEVQIRRLYDSLPQTVAPHLLMIPLHFHYLSAEEAKSLRTDRDADENFDSVTEVVDILSTILTGVTEPQLFSSFVDITVKMAADLMASAEIGSATRLIEVLRRLADSDNVPDGRGVMAARALDGYLTDTTIHSLRKAIDTAEAVTPTELHRLLLLLGKTSVTGICELLGRVERMKMRKVVLEVLIELGKEDPHVFTPLLADSRWYLVRNVVLILTRLNDSAMLEPVAGLISHPDQRVRKEVLTYLEKIPHPQAKTWLLKFLRDESQALRIRTLQILGESRFVFALKSVSAMVDRDGFEKAAMAEKKAIFETIGQLGQERMLPLFRTMLLKRHRFNRNKGQESAVCAMAGIRMIHSENAVKVLEEGLRGKNPAVHGLILQAIAAITGELGSAGGSKKYA